jgi:DNA polymerase III delta prime subunit
MKYLKLYEDFMEESLPGFNIPKADNYSGKNRIILIGPPTVGKSTVAEEISKKLGIEYVKLDKLQEDFGHGDGKEFELVKLVTSEDFEKYETPSILDFGGGHVYNDGVKELLEEYPNVILLMPSLNDQKSKDFLRKGNYERWSGFMNTLISAYQSDNIPEDKKQEYIQKIEDMKRGEAGLITKEELPNVPEVEGWGGLNMEKGWDQEFPLTTEEDKKNKDVSKHIVEVYNDDGTRRDKSDIAEDIIKLIK